VVIRRGLDTIPSNALVTVGPATLLLIRCSTPIDINDGGRSMREECSNENFVRIWHGDNWKAQMRHNNCHTSSYRAISGNLLWPFSWL
jgi:hypothetical protein